MGISRPAARQGHGSEELLPQLPPFLLKDGECKRQAPAQGQGLASEKDSSDFKFASLEKRDAAMQSPWQLLLVWRCWVASLWRAHGQGHGAGGGLGLLHRHLPHHCHLHCCALHPLETCMKQSLCAQHPAHRRHLVPSEMRNCSGISGYKRDNSPTPLSSLLLRCLGCTQVPSDLMLQPGRCWYLLWMEIILQGGSLLCCRNFSFCLRHTLAMSQVCAS